MYTSNIFGDWWIGRFIPANRLILMTAFIDEGCVTYKNTALPQNIFLSKKIDRVFICNIFAK